MQTLDCPVGTVLAASTPAATPLDVIWTRWTDELAATLSRVPEQVPGVYARASTLSGSAGAMARLHAHDAVALGEGFRAAWRALRCLLTGLPPRGRRQAGSDQDSASGSRDP